MGVRGGGWSLTGKQEATHLEGTGSKNQVVAPERMTGPVGGPHRDEENSNSPPILVSLTQDSTPQKNNLSGHV